MPARIVWLGDATRPEFATAFGRCSEFSDVRVCRDPDALRAWSQRDDFDPPDFVVLASPLPRMWSPDDLCALIRTWPLVRWIELLGDWRRHDVHPSPDILPFERMRVEEFSAARLGPSEPATATHAERLLDTFDFAPKRGYDIAFAAQRHDSSALRDWIASCGHSVRAVHEFGGNAELPSCFRPALLIVDVQGELDDVDRSASIRARFSTLPCLALVDFPCASNIDPILSGIEMVVRKTSSSRRLADAIERVIESHAEKTLLCR